MSSPSLTTAGTATAAPAVPARRGLAALALLCFGHFVIDLYAASLSALQPLLVLKLKLSLTQAGIAGGLLLVSSSVAQPIYGFLADRFHSRLFTVLAPAVAGVFLSALGLATGFGALLVLAILGGAGVASFHPQASSLATAGVERSRGSWMAVFISSGTLGMALGPTAFSLVSTRYGLENAAWMMIPGLAATAALLAYLPGPASTPERKKVDWNSLRAVWYPLTLLYALVFIRSAVQIVFAQFLPLYLHLERGLSVTESNFLLSLYLASGALGGFVGGSLADRIGGRRVIMISMIGCIPPLALFFFTTGWLSALGLMLGGLVLLFTIPVNVVMAQELAPTQTGTVSALMMGFAWGMAGMILVPLAGLLSDAWSLHRVLSALLLFPLAGFFVTRLLPKKARP
jgi:FSR family fosmidomycin resistance protein-like MFS transporter